VGRINLGKFIHQSHESCPPFFCGQAILDFFHDDLGFSLAHPTQLVGWAGLIWENLYIKAMSPAHRFLVGKQYWIFHDDLGFSLAHPTQMEQLLLTPVKKPENFQ
jgi:hypothetical protein